MKKILLCLLAIATWSNANATAKIENGVLYLNGSSDTNFEKIDDVSGWDSSVGVTKIVLSGDFTAGWSSGWLQNAGSGTPTTVTTIDMSDADFSGESSWKFGNFNNLTEIIWPKAGKITNIPRFAFQWTDGNPAIETLTIPGYIKTIKAQAFDSNSNYTNPKKIVFEDYCDENGKSLVNMSIATQAFSNCYGVTDVYVNTLGNIDAATMAFPEAITYGQGDTKRQTARLHFPASKYKDYVNTDDPLSPEVAADNGKFQAWLVNHYHKASTTSETKAGWYEFVSNGSSEVPDDDMGEVVLFTFSHATIDYLVPKGSKAYIVTGVTSSSDNTFSLTLKQVNVIPHGTGVIIFGGTNAKSADDEKRYLEMTAVNYTGKAFDRTTDYGGDYNLLVGTANAEGSLTAVKPYELEGSTVAWRNFAMGKFSSTDSGKKYKNDKGNYGTGDGLPEGNFVGFFRLKASNIASGKAYLRLKDTEYTNAEGGEVIVPEDTKYDVEYYLDQNEKVMSEADKQAKGYWYKNTQDSSSKITWKEGWGTRQLAEGFTMAKFVGEPFDSITGISTVSTEQTADNAVYNLQGVKVSQTGKGVYIKNGKKFVVK